MRDDTTTTTTLGASSSKPVIDLTAPAADEPRHPFEAAERILDLAA